MSWRPVISRNSEWLAAVGAFLVAALMAFLARGTAGDEELGHYLIARFAPVQPELYLSLVGRPLPTLALSLPAQFGLVPARLLAALATAGVVLGVARLLRRTRWLPAGAALPLVLLQPFLLAHAATAMTEPFSALLLTWGLVAYVERRAPLLALVASLLVLVRFELVVLVPVALLVLLAWRAWRSVPWIFLPTALWALLGGIAHGDPLWLLRAAQVRTYTQQEPWHYFSRLGWVLGPALTLPVLLGAGAAVAALRPATPRPAKVGGRSAAGPPAGPGDEEPRILRASLLLVGTGLAIYTLLAWWKPVTGGNLRYLAGLAGPLAVLAAAGFHELATPRRRRVILLLGAGLLLLAGPWGHALHRDSIPLHRFDPLPLVATLSIIAAAWLRPVRGLAPAAVALGAGVVALGLNYASTLHWSPSPEQATAAVAAREMKRRGVADGAIYASHPFIAWTLGRNPYDPRRCPPVNAETPGAAPPGSLLFWDTHYLASMGPAPGAEVFLTHPDWEFLAAFTAPDSNWSTGVFRRRSGGGGETPPVPEARAWAIAVRDVQLHLGFTREIVARDPGAVDAWRSLAQQLLLAGRIAEATRTFEHARRLEPDSPENDAFAAMLATRQGHSEEALAAWQRVLARIPDQGDYQFQTARILARLGRPAEAVPHLRIAAARLPRRFDIQYATGSFLAGQGAWREAEPYLRAAAALQPDNVDAATRAAEAAVNLGQMDAAETRLREILRRQPRIARCYLALADLLTRRGRSAEARALLEAGAAATASDEIRARLTPSPGPAR